jgi:hypothetical protein
MDAAQLKSRNQVGSGEHYNIAVAGRAEYRDAVAAFVRQHTHQSMLALSSTE